MALAKGSKSKLVWSPELTFGVIPTASAYKGLSFTNETLVESVDQIKSDNIQADRSPATIRGGNFALGGAITCDFAIRRYFSWLQRLFPKYPATVPVSAVPTTLTTGASVTRLTPYMVSTSCYLALTTGTYTKVGATVADDFAGFTSGTQTIGGVTWQAVEGYDSDYHTVASTAATASSIYPAGLAIEKQFKGGSGDLYVMYGGGRINSLDLNIPQKGIVKATWNLLFLNSQTSTTGTLGNAGASTYPDDDPVTGYDTAIYVNNVLSGRPMRDGSLTFSNNYDAEAYVVGSRDRQDIVPGERSASGKFTLFFKDSTEYDLFKLESKVSVEFLFVHKGEFLQIKFAEAKITGAGTPQISGAGLLTASFDFTAFHESSTNWLTFAAGFIKDPI